MATNITLFCTLLFLLIFHKTQADGEALEKEKNLFERFFLNKTHNHNPFIRPVSDPSDVISVHVGLAVFNLIHVDEKMGTVSLQVWQRMSWKDISLSWDPAKWGITSLQVPPEKIWTPDMVLYNSASQNSNSRLGAGTQAVVRHDGHVTWIPPLIINAICQLDMTYYPKDRHECYLKFGSWTHDASKLDLALFKNSSTVDMSFFTKHGSWDLSGGSAEIKVKKYPCCDELFPDITFHLSLIRSSDFLQHSLAAPVIMLSLLVPLVFLVPARNSHKTILGVGLLISLSVFMTNLGDTIPSTASSAPLICKYYVSTFFLLCISICLSSFILCASGGMLSRSRRPPRFFKKVLVDRLGKMCCIPTGASLGVPEADNLVLATVEPNPHADQGIEKSHETRRHASSAIVEWILIAHVCDRILFVLFEIVSLVLIVSFLGQL